MTSSSADVFSFDWAQNYLDIIFSVGFNYVKNASFPCEISELFRWKYFILVFHLLGTRCLVCRGLYFYHLDRNTQNKRNNKSSILIMHLFTNSDFCRSSPTSMSMSFGLRILGRKERHPNSRCDRSLMGMAKFVSRIHQKKRKQVWAWILRAKCKKKKNNNQMPENSVNSANDVFRISDCVHGCEWDGVPLDRVKIPQM